MYINTFDGYESSTQCTALLLSSFPNGLGRFFNQKGIEMSKNSDVIMKHFSRNCKYL